MGSWEGYVTSPLYVFNNGAWNGVTSTGMSTAYASGSDRDYLYVGTTITCGVYEKNGCNCSYRTNSVVDLSNYNYLNFKISSNDFGNNGNFNGLNLGASTESQLSSISGFSANVRVGARLTGVQTINVTALKGKYYIYIYCTFYGSSDYKGSSVVSLEQIYLSA